VSPPRRSRSRGCAPAPLAEGRGALDLHDLKDAHAASRRWSSGPRRRSGPRRTGRWPPRCAGSGTQTAAIVRAGRAAVPYAGPIHWGWRARHIKAQPWLYDAIESTPASRWTGVPARAGPTSSTPSKEHRDHDHATPHLINALEETRRAQPGRSTPRGAGPPSARAALVTCSSTARRAPGGAHHQPRHDRLGEDAARHKEWPASEDAPIFATTFVCGPPPSGRTHRPDVRAVRRRRARDWRRSTTSRRTLPGRQRGSAVRRAVARHTHSVPRSSEPRTTPPSPRTSSCSTSAL
jgi:hypothetical protein